MSKIPPCQPGKIPFDTTTMSAFSGQSAFESNRMLKTFPPMRNILARATSVAFGLMFFWNMSKIPPRQPMRIPFDTTTMSAFSGQSAFGSNRMLKTFSPMRNVLDRAISVAFGFIFFEIWVKYHLVSPVRSHLTNVLARREEIFKTKGAENKILTNIGQILGLKEVLKRSWWWLHGLMS